MSATAWLIIAIVGFSLSGIALAISIILFIKMDVLAIIGDLTGKTVAREIKAMRETNAASGDKRFRPSAVNMERGKLTEKVNQSAEAMKIAHADHDLSASGSYSSPRQSKSGTVGLGESSTIIPSKTYEPPKQTDVLSQAQGTEVLSQGTEVLSQGTEVLSQGTEVLSQGTEVLSQGTEVLTSGTTVLNSGTTVLNSNENTDNQVKSPVSFTVVRSEVIIHSNEVI